MEAHEDRPALRGPAPGSALHALLDAEDALRASQERARADAAGVVEAARAAVARAEARLERLQERMTRRVDAAVKAEAVRSIEEVRAQADARVARLQGVDAAEVAALADRVTGLLLDELFGADRAPAPPRPVPGDGAP